MAQNSSIASCAQVADLGTCNTLDVQGATDAQLLAVGDGCLDPVLLMGILSGVSAAPDLNCTGGITNSTNVVDTSGYSSIAELQPQTQDTLLTSVSNSLSGIAAYWPIILAGALALLIIILAIR